MAGIIMRHQPGRLLQHGGRIVHSEDTAVAAGRAATHGHGRGAQGTAQIIAMAVVAQIFAGDHGDAVDNRRIAGHRAANHVGKYRCYLLIEAKGLDAAPPPGIDLVFVFVLGHIGAKRRIQAQDSIKPPMKTNKPPHSRPVVMVIGGQDPSGGAGLQADIEAVMAAGCHAVTVLAAVTVQDSASVRDFMVMEPSMVVAQMRTVMADFAVAAVKTGMMGSASNITAVSDWLKHNSKAPLVVDPVLASNTGDRLALDDLVPAYRETLLPLTTIATPNSEELKRLAADASGQAGAAADLLALGCGHVFVTGGHAGSGKIHNKLYSANDNTSEMSWPRLPHEYHGSGCTLAAAVAAQLALGEKVKPALTIAQAYTYQALARGERLGRGQWIPLRKT